MNSLSESEESTEYSSTLSGPIFSGDTGALPMEVRRALVLLLLGPFMDVRRHPKLWPVLLLNESVIRSRLHELFLELTIDHEQQIAFTRQVEEGGVDVPVLLRRAPLTDMDTKLVIHLRNELTQADARGERAVVSEDDLHTYLAIYEPPGTTDHAKFGKRVTASIEKAKRLNLLQKLRGSEERFEVSPTLKILFSVEEMLAIQSRYDALLAAGSVAANEEESEDTEEVL